MVATTDSSGNLVDGYVYEPFGTLLESHEPHANPWQFQSGFYDNSTGLYKFGTRYYDPTVGRWTQRDPVAGSLADVQGLNRYLFVGDDPINAVDPSGKASCALSWFLWLSTVAVLIGILIITSGTAAIILGALALELTNLTLADVTSVACTGQISLKKDATSIPCILTQPDFLDRSISFSPLGAEP